MDRYPKIYNHSKFYLTQSFFADEDEDQIPTPLLTQRLLQFDIQSIACGDYHNAALTKDGNVYTWGGGILGSTEEANDSNPTVVRRFVDTRRRVSNIHAGGALTLAKAGKIDSGSNSIDEYYVWGYLKQDGKYHRAKTPSLLGHVVKEQVLFSNVGPGGVAFLTSGGNGEKQGCTLMVYSGVGRDAIGEGMPFRREDAKDMGDVCMIEPFKAQIPLNSSLVAGISMAEDFGLILCST